SYPHIQQNLVGFYVVVAPRKRYGLRMSNEHPGIGRSNRLTANFKRPMDRRRLMNRASDWLEFLRVKRERIYVSIPANNIERMMCHRHNRPTGAIFYQNFRVAFRIGGIQLGRSMQITLRVW